MSDHDTPTTPRPTELPDDDPSAASPAVDEAPKKRSGWRRFFKWFGICAVLLLLIALLVAAFLPSILNSSIGRARIVSALESRLQAPVELGEYALGWGSVQRVDSLRVGASSAAGFRAEDPLFHLQQLEIQSGLWALAFGKGPVDVEIARVDLDVLRNSEGRFNFEEITAADEDAGSARSDEPAEGGASGDPLQPLRDLGRQLSLVIAEANIRYDDRVLDARSEFVRYGVDVQAGPSGVRAQIGPRDDTAVSPPKGGWLVADLNASSDGKAQSVEDLRIESDIRIRQLDLRPYRGLLEEFAQWTPPDEPIDGHFHVTTADRVVSIASALDAHFASVEGVVGRIPLEATNQSAASFKVPFQVDIAPTLASLSSRVSLPEGSRVSGALTGSLELVGGLSLERLQSEGIDALRNLEFDLALDGKDLDVLWPGLSTEDPAGEGETERVGGTGTPKSGLTADGGAESAAPIVFQEPLLGLRWKVRTGDSPFDLRIERGDITASGVRIGLTGGLQGVAPAAASTSAVPEQWNLDLSPDLEISIGRILTLLPGLPTELRAGDDTSVKLGGFRVGGNVQKGVSLLETVTAAGKVLLDGDLEYEGFGIGALSTELSVKDRVIRLTETSAGVNQGRLQGELLSLDFSGDVPVYKLGIDLADVQSNYDLAPLLQWVLPFLSLDATQGELAGLIHAKLSIEGRGFELAQLQENLKGSGELSLSNGHFSGSKFFQQVSQLVGEDFGRVLFQKIGSEFSLGDGSVQVGKLALDTRKGSETRSLGFEGVTHFNGNIDYGVNLAALEASIGDRKIRRILGDARKVLGSDAFPLRLGGTLAAPNLSFDSSLGLGNTLQGALKKVLGDGDAGDKGRKALGGILGRDGKKVLDGVLEGEAGKDVKRAIDDALDIFGGRKKKRPKKD